MPTIRWKDKTIISPDDDQDRIPITDDTDSSDKYTTATRILGDLLKSGKDLSPVSADKGFYTSSSDTLATFDLTSAGLALLDDADAAEQRATLGVSSTAEIAAAYQPLDSDLTAIAALTTTSFGRAFLALANEAAFKAAVNLEVGTDVQAQDALLQTIADAVSFDAAGLVAKSGDQTGIAGTKQFLGLLTLVAGLRAQVPADFWSVSTPAVFTPQGGFSTMGSYAMDFFSNGYRNNSTLWTSLAQNGYLGAGVLSFKPTDGSILFCTSDNWPTGSAYIPPTRIKVRGDNGNVRIGAGGSEDGKLNVQGTQKISSWLQTIGTTVALLDSSAPDGSWDFATNGRKPGEGASSGTGVPVFCDGGVWYSLADWTAVAA